jgi:DNA-binding response OmpR family regulator
MWPLRSHPDQGRTLQDTHRFPEVLAILGNSRDQTTVTDFATGSHWGLTIVNTLEQASRLATEKMTSIILLDRDLAGNGWRSTVHRLSRNQFKPCIILASSVVDPYLFDELVSQGGFDIVAKPIRADELRRIGHLAFAFWKNRRANNSNT